MSELIKELSKKALLETTLQVENLELKNNRIYNVSEFNEIYSQNLGKLIVLECSILVDSKTSDNGCGVADSWCEGKDLLEHFGAK